MPQRSVSERISLLRRAIAALESAGRTSASLKARGPSATLDRAPSGSQRSGSGDDRRDPFERLLDHASHGFSEIVPACPAAMAEAASFAFALAVQGVATRPRAGLVWIVEEMAAREIGLPYGRGAEAWGLALHRLLLVRARRPAETFWAMEEALKAKTSAAVVAETWLAPAAYGLAASRRLALAAERGQGAGFLLLPRAAGEAARIASAARLRFEIAAFAGDGSLFQPFPCWRVRLAKARASLLGGGGGFDLQDWRGVVFDPERAALCHALPFDLPASPADRPHPAACASAF